MQHTIIRNLARILTAEISDLDLTPPRNLSFVFDLVSGNFECLLPTTEPKTLRQCRYRVALPLLADPHQRCRVENSASPGSGKVYVVVVEAITGTTTFWPLRGVYCKELAEEYDEKDPESTSLIIGKPLVDSLACVVDVVGVISIDSYTKAGVVTVVAANRAFGQRFQCGIHVRAFEM
ncbi:hypothetical protein RhiLY_08373 [Ceratobasidium sp. AG-Ba]|nr:hypothetical protein RhiLY_08373 [Ceratobasidium sp. AG-Ba]